jgi:hypothetical protein
MGILAINISYLRHEEVGLAAYFVRSELIISVRVSMGAVYYFRPYDLPCRPQLNVKHSLKGD